MREIEIRRHAFTKKGDARGKGTQLSAEGVAIARKLSQEMGTFARVFSSDIPRTLETAVAMGYAVDDGIVPPAELIDAAIRVVGHHERWAWEQPWAKFAALVRQRGPVADLGSWLYAAWAEKLAEVADGERVLIISHGRMIEIGVIACLPDLPIAEFADWGEPLHHLEGVRMSYSDGQLVHPHLLRE
jgi:broad specificity phosphatase PhoE